MLDDRGVEAVYGKPLSVTTSRPRRGQLARAAGGAPPGRRRAARRPARRATGPRPSTVGAELLAHRHGVARRAARAMPSRSSAGWTLVQYARCTEAAVGVAQPHQSLRRAAPSCPRRSPARPRASGSSGQPAALREELDGVAPEHPVDVVVVEARRPASPRRSRAVFSGSRAAPVGGGVDQHPLGPVPARMLDHPVLVHLRVRVDGEAQPAAGVPRPADGQLVEVVDAGPSRGRCRTRATTSSVRRVPGGLVAVRGVHQRRQLVLDGERELGGEAPRPRPASSSRSRSRRPRRRRPWPGSGAAASSTGAAARVVGLLGVQADRAVVADAELRGAEGLPAEQRVEVVDERAGARARLPEPERGLDDGADARRRPSRS